VLCCDIFPPPPGVNTGFTNATAADAVLDLAGKEDVKSRQAGMANM